MDANGTQCYDEVWISGRLRNRPPEEQKHRRSFFVGLIGEISRVNLELDPIFRIVGRGDKEQWR